MADKQLVEYSEADRADYLAVVASMAGADGTVSPEESAALQRLCERFILGPEACGRVMAATAPGAEDLDAALKRLAGTDLKVALLADLCSMAWQDDQLVEAEKAGIWRIAGRLGLTPPQVASVLHFVSSLRKGTDPELCLKLLEASGVPCSAVALSATLYELGQSGVGIALTRDDR